MTIEYSYIKSKKHDNVSVAPLRSGGKYFIDDTKKADILNKQYCSVFSENDEEIPIIRNPTVDTMNDIIISEKGVLLLLQRIKSFKAAGPDGIKARFLFEFSEQIYPALTLVYNASRKQGNVPSHWRHALVVPAYKGNNKNRSSPESYRPISLTSIVCKTMEHILYSNIMSHLNNNNVLTDFQHGFREKRSCETQLLLTVNDFANNLNQGEQVDSILLDFSKAFDSIDHNILLKKLPYYHFTSSAIKLMSSYLTDRSQYVKLGDHRSTMRKISIGVSQGSVLGPILFLIFINHPINSAPQLEYILFADDTYIFSLEPQVLK